MSTVKQRINEIGNDLIKLSAMSNDTPNHDVELECALGALIKCLQIQLKKLEKSKFGF